MFWEYFLLELPHFLLTLGIALLFFTRYRHWQNICLAFLTGFLIDLDHLFDFWVYSNSLDHLLAMFSGNYFIYSQKIYVLLHGWELLPVWFWMGKWMSQRLKIKGLQWSLPVAYLGHLMIDQFSGYTQNPLAYFLTYRLLNHFSLASFH